MSSNNITTVLALGALADGSSWETVSGQLQSREFEAVTVPIPLTLYAGDFAALERKLEGATQSRMELSHA